MAEETPPNIPETPQNPPEGSLQILPKVVEAVMKEAYLNYAMSVIVGRALPDVRDGLKPVHRRILYAMHEMGLSHNKPFKKSARIVGDCLGKYHPHGDTAIYDSLVRLAQDFSLRYPLVKGQGNFGSVDGDNAAHQRYTEAKLTKLAEDLLQDIEKNTVDFRDNFDGSLQEPVVLPSLVPNLLVNGSSGIAVGMTTNIPPHNMSEICAGIMALIDNPELTVEDLLRLIPGPDFPTGGEVLCGSALRYAYAKGHGKVVIKSVTELEGNKIIVKEIPYQVNKAELIEQIAQLVREKRIPDIRNINDESDREGIRIVIDLKTAADPQIVLNQLYEYSRLKISFNIILLALVDEQPKLLGLKSFLQHHIEHRRVVIVRRTEFELDQARQQVHLLQGLLVALENLDTVIPGIRNSKTVDEARDFLMSAYSLTEKQAKAILEMRLQKLASLEQQKIRDEHGELLLCIARYQELLASEQKVLELIKEEARYLQQTYGDKRRSKITLIEGEDDGDLNMEDLIEDEPAVVTITQSGYVKRLAPGEYKTQRRGGKGVIAAGMKDEDAAAQLYVAATHDYLLCFTDQGQLYWLKVWQIPEASRQAKGKHIANLLQLRSGEMITFVVPVRDFREGYLVMATKQGTVKKTELQEFSNPRRDGIRALSLEPNDTLVGVKHTDGKQEIILATKLGQANRFREEDVRPMGRTAYGVRGIRLDQGDRVVGMLAADETKYILTITELGYGKRTPVQDYRLCNRGGKGVTNIKTTDKNGPVKAVMLVDGKEELMLISQQGQAIRIACADISVIGRATQGVRVMRLQENDRLAAAAKITMPEEVTSVITPVIFPSVISSDIVSSSLSGQDSLPPPSASDLSSSPPTSSDQSDSQEHLP